MVKKNKISFSGHDKFECKIDWIIKGLYFFSKDNSLFVQSNIEKSIERLGLGINMIKSLNHWMQALGLIEKSSLTKLGHIILEKDPYLENIDTLWLLHWNVVKNKEKATLYNLFFNNIYPNKFTKEEIFNDVNSWLENKHFKLSPTTLRSDIDVFIRLYKSNTSKNLSLNLFSELKIITEQTNGIYTLNVNKVADISDYAFIYILLDYIHTLNFNISESISMDDIQRGKLSIQKSLCIGESKLYNNIHQLEQLTDGKLSYSEASGMKQIYINNLPNQTDIINRIYQ